MEYLEILLVPSGKGGFQMFLGIINQSDIKKLSWGREWEGEAGMKEWGQRGGIGTTVVPCQSYSFRTCLIKCIPAGALYGSSILIPEQKPRALHAPRR